MPIEGSSVVDFKPRLIRATVEDSAAGLDQTFRTGRPWVVFPRRLGAVHEFTGAWAARRNSRPMQALGVGQLRVIRTPWVAPQCKQKQTNKHGRGLFDGIHGITEKQDARTRHQTARTHRCRSETLHAGRVQARCQDLPVRRRSFRGPSTSAHRGKEWHVPACQVRLGSDVYIDTIGTFGVPFASYYRSGVAAALGRFSQHCAGDTGLTWHMLVADDNHLEAGGSGYRPALTSSFFLCAVCGDPLSWTRRLRERERHGLVGWLRASAWHFQLRGVSTQG